MFARSGPLQTLVHVHAARLGVVRFVAAVADAAIRPQRVDALPVVAKAGHGGALVNVLAQGPETLGKIAGEIHMCTFTSFKHWVWILV